MKQVHEKRRSVFNISFEDTFNWHKFLPFLQTSSLFSLLFSKLANCFVYLHHLNVVLFYILEDARVQFVLYTRVGGCSSRGFVQLAMTVRSSCKHPTESRNYTDSQSKNTEAPPSQLLKYHEQNHSQ